MKQVKFTVNKYSNEIYLLQYILILGNILSPKTILSCLDFILKDNQSPAEYAVGILTTENRNVWADARQHMIKAGNERFLHLVDSAVLNLVLDDEEMAGDPYKMVRHFLHGDGKNR